MNPCAWDPSPVLVDVGSGGDDDVNVVASRVGLNLRDVAFGRWPEAELVGTQRSR